MKENDHSTSTTIQNIMTRIQRQRRQNHNHRPGGGNGTSWLTSCALMSLLVGFAVYNIRYFAKRKARLKEMGQLPYQQQEQQQQQEHFLKRTKWVTEFAQPFVSSVFQLGVCECVCV